MAIVTQGIQLGYKASSSATSYTALTNLQEIPDLGGKADSIEITTLDDTAHVYTAGLQNYGDSIDFVFLFDNTQFTTLNAMTSNTYWEVKVPLSGSTNMSFTFSGVPSVKLDGKGINDVLTYTLSIKPSSAITVA